MRAHRSLALTFALILGVIYACQPAVFGRQAAPGNDAPRAAAATMALADEVVASIRRQTPELATYLGLPGADHGAISDNSLEARAAVWREQDGFRERLAAIDGEKLAGGRQWVVHGFLREFLETSFQTRVCESELWNVDQMGGWQTTYGQIARIQPIDTDPLQQQALSRFRGLARFADREIANLREGLRKGYAAPRRNVEQVITQMRGFGEASSPYFSPAERASSPAFAAAWRELMSTVVVPAFQKYESFLRDEYLPGARASVAVAELPGGAECYRARLREFTGLPLTAEEVHRTGLQELERIAEEERAIARRLFGDPDLDRAFARLKDPQYRWKDRDAVLAHARAAAERAGKAMPRVFGLVPKTAVIITPVPAVEEPTSSDRYQPGTIDGARPGEYQINVGRWFGQSKEQLESVVFHETIPGHHLQITISLERPDAHLITQLVGTSAFVEGWGLYAERLADEMQLYSSDVDRLGMWQSRAFRAARLVVDTGLHALGWPRDRAVAFMQGLHLGSDEEISAEVDRYIIWPGQATAYMTGALVIERSRAEAEKRLGQGFDLRRFHDTVLGDGALPLSMMEEKVRRMR